jgi:hypothetical protein
MDEPDGKRAEDAHERSMRLAAEGKLPPLRERLTDLGPTADERIPLLEDRLEEIDVSGAKAARWYGRSRLGHAIGALVTVVLLLAWALCLGMPELFRDLARALLGGR